MARRRKKADNFEAIAKLFGALVILVAFSMGGLHKLPEAIVTVFGGLVILSVLILGVLILWGYFKKGRASGQNPFPSVFQANTSSGAPTFTKYEVYSEQQSTEHLWNPESVLAGLGQIDWYQFEKFCAALLWSEGFEVERKGGAQPDGGVDLIATKDGVGRLIQCKHWKTWEIKEKVVREMLGSMTHFQVNQGAIYTLKGWTAPAWQFAEQHQITLVDGVELATRAARVLSKEVLDELLNCATHHCPKCESAMIWRTGDFEPFWGCSRYPRCQGVLRQSGAR